MHEFNPFVLRFKQFALECKLDDKINLILKDDPKHKSQTKLPTTSEVAVVMPGNIKLYYIVKFTMISGFFCTTTFPHYVTSPLYNHYLTITTSSRRFNTVKTPVTLMYSKLKCVLK